MKDKKLERCANRHCKREFVPRGQRRFCTEACQQAAAYGLRRTAKGPRRRRLTPLATPIAATIENGHFLSTKTIGCKPTSVGIIDLLGGTRNSGKLDRETWEKILWREVCE